MANNKSEGILTDTFSHVGWLVLSITAMLSLVTMTKDQSLECHLWVHRLPHGHFPAPRIFRCGRRQSCRPRRFRVSNRVHLPPQLPLLHVLHKGVASTAAEVRPCNVCCCPVITVISWFEFSKTFVLSPRSTWSHRLSKCFPARCRLVKSLANFSTYLLFLKQHWIHGRKGPDTFPTDLNALSY